MTYVWLNLKEQLGLEVRVARSSDGETAPESLFSLADEHTKAVTVCHVDSGNGYRHDLKTIGTWCREHTSHLVWMPPRPAGQCSWM